MYVSAEDAAGHRSPDASAENAGSDGISGKGKREKGGQNKQGKALKTGDSKSCNPHGPSLRNVSKNH